MEVVYLRSTGSADTRVVCAVFVCYRALSYRGASVDNEPSLCTFLLSDGLETLDYLDFQYGDEAEFATGPIGPWTLLTSIRQALPVSWSWLYCFGLGIPRSLDLSHALVASPQG